MKKSIKKLGAGIALVVGLGLGCYQYTEPPEGTVELPEWNQEKIEAFLSEGHYHAPGASDLLEISDPLFDRYGDDVDDNSDLVGMVYTLEGRLNYYLEREQIVGFYSEDIPEHAIASAFFVGGDTPNFLGDDYIVVRLDEYNFTARTDTMYHEAAHAFKWHDEGMKEYIDDTLESYRFWFDEDFIDTMIDERDTAYLMTIYFSYMDNLVRWTASEVDYRISFIDDNIENYEEGDPCIETRLLNPETWISYQYYDAMPEKFGMTEEEVLDSVGYVYEDLMPAYRDALIEQDPEHIVYCWDF